MDSYYSGAATKLSETHAFGCIAGAFIGDSCGQIHTFATKELSEVEMDFCMTLPGGGPFHLNPGQLTDGGEMAMCLMNGLIANEESDTLDLRPIVEQYRKWVSSEPFDIDDTI